jgi:septal ring factor EnvC (AmiA/AmiB activator)
MEGSISTQKSNFPYKTLIWVLFAVLALFIFKPELKQLLNNAEELTVFGIEIKAGKEKAHKLEVAIEKFKNNIADLSSQITDQQDRINSLNKLKKELEKDIANCPDAKKSTLLFNAQVMQIYDKNKTLKTQSDKLKNVKILERNTLTNLQNSKIKKQ